MHKQDLDSNVTIRPHIKCKNASRRPPFLLIQTQAISTWGMHVCPIRPLCCQIGSSSRWNITPRTQPEAER